MKYSILLLLCFACAITLQAQNTYLYKLPKTADTSLVLKNIWSDSLLAKIPYYKKPYAPLIAGAMPKKLYYLGNNGQGMDIYQTPHDNMCILKPDFTFSSNMPVVNTLITEYKPVAIPNATPPALKSE